MIGLLATSGEPHEDPGSVYCRGNCMRHRHCATVHTRPRITGRAQVKGRNALSREEHFRLDVWYANKRSLWLDIKILTLTALIVTHANNISQEDHVTQENFVV